MAGYAKDVLVDARWVEDHLGDPGIRIVEVDEDPRHDAERHVPGAIGLDWRRDLQDQVRRSFLGPEAFGELFGSRGIGDEHLVVLYGDRNNWFAAYTYWYLKYYGHEAVRLMNGPREKWIEEGRPTSTEVPDHPRARFVAREGDWAQAVREDGTFKSAEELAALYRDKGVIDGSPVIAYCRIGERSAHTWFVLHELLGEPDVRNYDGSWTEWGNLVDVPIERGPEPQGPRGGGERA